MQNPLRYASLPYESRWDDIKEHLDRGKAEYMDVFDKRDIAANARIRDLVVSIADANGFELKAADGVLPRHFVAVRSFKDVIHGPIGILE